MVEFDELDRKILRQMQRDCALPLETLGERIGLSRNAVWRRVKRLEETGVIRARVALVAPEAVGRTLQVFIAVRTSAHEADWLERFAKATREMEEIIGVYRMTGELDYLIRARVADIADYDALYQRLIRRIPMADVSASFVMEEIKETTALTV
ncbi:Lrp/AsnC family transcriptional regulator [Pikeienuella piscinae]|uniref:Lrp/AsnC family transcriptional regulator n=2 Tax=Pikeienuella piscinae TaxID=2748098 RepID=A0A7L5BWK9_9RHOB|nr:Lrp/AsnC family transcriptional regulator [Pikeienuella piscinae]QIE54927.1 Lrp/AsnC family transcriptional regulator [Pikeienuella piscinae]